MIRWSRLLSVIRVWRNSQNSLSLSQNGPSLAHRKRQEWWVELMNISRACPSCAIMREDETQQCNVKSILSRVCDGLLLMSVWIYIRSQRNRFPFIETECNTFSTSYIFGRWHKSMAEGWHPVNSCAGHGTPMFVLLVSLFLHTFHLV